MSTKAAAEKKTTKKATATKTKATSKRPATKTKGVKGERKPRENTVNQFVIEQVKAGKTNEQVAKDVMKKFPDSAMVSDEAKCKKYVAWYVWKARKDGTLPAKKK